MSPPNTHGGPTIERRVVYWCATFMHASTST